VAYCHSKAEVLDMSRTEVVLSGAVTADGQLILDGKPGLPPGRVEVVLRPVGTAPGSEGGLVGALQRIWAAQEARGFVGEPWEGLVAELDARRDEWDRRDGPAEVECGPDWGGPLGPGE
jgi:hypothetical protein